MPKETKLYDLLGVSPTANDQEIKKGYRKMALKFHPDKPTGDTEKFKEISEAFDILSSEEKREIYDAYGLEAARGNPNAGGGPPGGAGGFGGAGGPGFSFSSGGGAGGHPFSQADAFNMFNQFGGFDGLFGGSGGGMGGGSPFGQQFGGGGMPGGFESRQQRREPEVVDLSVPVTLEELYNGGVKKMKINRKGMNGQKEEKIIEINLKPGWKAGTKLSYPESGDYADGQRQTLRFTITQKPHQSFTRDDNDLIAVIPLTFKESLLGFSKDLYTLSGKRIPLSKSIPTNPSSQDRYPNLGMPISKTPGKYGDLIIKYKIDYPIVLSQNQKEAISQVF